MTLGDKLRSLRAVEGQLRGLGRPMTQSEVVTAMKKELGRGLSQAYLSQIESGARPHMTNTSRDMLARFFKVYPGFLVDDPPGYSRELQSDLRMADATVDSWLYAGAEHFSGDSELSRAIQSIAQEPDSREALLLLGEILRTPGLAERLGEVLRPRPVAGSGHPPPVSN
ncbi:MAG TPA: helix-turn-helix domain-containing protein [Candidatus Saccharimonadales bacterium]|nr:helix-turn-helix domain-containing protein [Candidatus Saccharimonadales bacterium]